MEAFAILFVLAIALPIAWLASEFQRRRWLRITLGLLALLACLGACWINSSADTYFLRHRYSGATNALVKAVSKQLEVGNYEGVRRELNCLERDYAPIGEQLYRYDALVRETAIRLNAASTTTTSTAE